MFMCAVGVSQGSYIPHQEATVRTPPQTEEFEWTLLPQRPKAGLEVREGHSRDTRTHAESVISRVHHP